MSSFRSKLKKAVALSLTALTASAGMSCLPNTVVNAQTANTLSNINRGILFANSRTDFRDESIYFVITTRFYDGDPSNNARTSEDTKAKNPENDPSWRGDFKGLIDKLDYIKALGFTAIWITPVVENNSGYDYHGYHAYDFSAVDKRYESNGVTYQTLIDACHAKGMKVIGLTGAKDSKLSAMADICVKVPSEETYQIQELHLPVYHCWCLMLEAAFFGEV